MSEFKTSPAPLDATQEPLIQAADFERLIREQVGMGEHFHFTVSHLSRGRAVLHYPFDPRTLRPGAAISGPTQFTIADTALYAAVLSVIGMQPLAVTTDMTMHFLRKAPAAALRAEAQLLKIGRSIAMGRVDLYSEALLADGSPRMEPVSHAVGSYHVPDPRSVGSRSTS